MKRSRHAPCRALALRALLTTAIAGVALIVWASPLATFSDSALSQTHYTVRTVSFGNGGPSNVAFGPGTINMSIGVNATSTASTQSLFVLCNWARWDPAVQGAIRALNYKETLTCSTGLVQVGAGLALVQGTGSNVRFYRAPAPALAMSGASQSVALSNLSASSFHEILPSGSDTHGIALTSHPDFSASGGPIQFGILRQKAQRSGRTEGKTTCEDWRVEVIPQ